ncbi:hybrid non-ribosomal peptide synthetase/type I polyketide synthase [Paraburkholderia fungorum]|uniref:hybrid non-ribosomal peptide synthetase/type I polyketide synthase n=1 Tax=Paraburkholderia fungorum TaxID=134537 RepID=UPI0038BDE9BB
MNIKENHFTPDHRDARKTVRLQPTAAQRRLWLVSGGDVRSATYNVPIALRLDGVLDRAALEEAVASLVERHPTLRARFRSEDDQLVVEAGESLPVLRTLDLGHLPSAEQSRMVATYTQQEVEHLFDLAAGQPLSMMLLRLADDRHVLLMNLHHMVVDNWSLTLLLDELSDTYRAFRRGEALALGPVDYQTDDHDEMSDDGHVETLRAYWRDQLADAPHLHTIPTDRPRSREACNRGARVTFALKPALLEGLHRVGRAAGTTPYMTGLAAFAALLHRYSSAQDVVIGSPFANRLTDAQQERIGFYSNLIPLRFRFDGTPSFMDLLAQARENVLDAFDHAGLSFDEIVEVARPPRSSSYPPVFQVMFDMVGGSLQTFTLDGLSVNATLLDSGTSKYDLNLELIVTAERLSGRLEYDTDLFDAGTAERFVGHFERLLDNVLRTPDAPIAQATLLSTQELDQVLRFAKPARPLGAPPFVSIPERISRQAGNTPDATAMVYLDERLTYRQLDRRVEQLANRLRAQGIKKGQRVATFIAYSPDNVIAFLAIQRVGAVFLPLGPADRRFPEKLEDSQPSLIISRSQDAGGIDSQTAYPVLLVDDIAQTIPATDTASALATLDETDPAYVIYTSGSTGKPKGVEVNHGSLHASFFGWCDAYRFGQPGLPVALQLAGPTFDLYIGDLVRTLSLGGCLVLCPREWLLEAGQLHRLIADEKVTFGDFPPVVLRQLIRYCNETGRRLDGFETLVCGADVWFGHELQAAQALCAPHARVLGSYGVTEAAIDSSAFDPAEHALAPASVVPIGRPLSSCELYVVDGLMQLLPVGLPGELLIAGTPVATGYLNRPELNAEKFFSGSFDASGRFVAGSGTGTTRIYRSGDICRMLADGTIEFLGRRDNQVKIRGFRVELGEIESVLAEHPEVEQSAVIAHGTHSDDLVLIGYAVTTASVETLLDYLRSRLPAHMVPVALERLPELPLTPSGKIDRKRLPIPDFSTVQACHTAPRNPTESRMLAIWQKVLSTASPGVHDNFFHCGGHSLAAARLVAQINRAFSTRWNMSVVFDRPTIAELAELAVGEMLTVRGAGQNAVDETTGNTTGDSTDVAAPLARPVDPSLLSFGQRSLWFVATRRRGASDYNLPDALQLDGPLDRFALTQALNDVLVRHSALRTTFSATVREVRDAQSAAGYEPSLSVHDGMHVELVVIDAFGADHAERTRLRHAEAAREFDLSQGPLMRATLLAFGPHEHMLCVTFHHIAVDGRSIVVFWHDLERCYNARTRGATPTLAPLKAHYANFIAWQRSFVDSPEFASQMQFWRQRLDVLPAPLRLNASPPQFTTAATSATVPASVLFPLDNELVAAVDRLCHATNCTPFIAYCALFALLLHRESGQSDIVTGIPSSTRSDDVFDDVIGFFVNTLPLRLDFDDVHTFRDLLLRVRQASLDVYTHRDVPFEVLMQTLNPPRTPGRNPIFQTSFTCDLDDVTPPRLKDLVTTRVPLDTNNAKFDLDMSIEKVGGTVFGRLMSRHPALDAAALGRMHRRYVALTRAVLTTPDVTWDTLTLDVAPALNGVRHAQDSQTLTAMIDRTIAMHPARTALELDNTATSYRELDALATALAGTLGDLGIGLGAHVGIFTGSHPHMVTAMLGILRAGAVFVPLDPAQRDQGWNEHVIADASLAAIVCREGVAHDAACLGPPVVNLDRTDPQTIRTPRRVVPVQSDDGACIIYTSGSTGAPKGAVLSHRNLVSTVPRIAESVRATRTSRTAQFFAASFDGVLAEVLPALLSGGAVIFGSRTQLLPGPGMVDWLAEKRITHLAIVPSALGLMPDATLPDLQVITVAGEACPLETARRWAPGRLLVNGYGPTECAIAISMCEYWDEGEKMALRPLDGLRFHVLDEALNEVGIGESGELFCGGPCVGYGYLGLPARTAQGFVADRFAPQAGGRLYRTGDTVRRLADGSVEFIGRADRQVKIRGNRIELDAVAAALNAIDGVQQAAALARIDQQGQKELVAYVVARCSKAELLAALRAKVPPPMVPSSLTFLEQMPLGRTGKIDMKALAALRPSRADDHVALPTTSAQSVAPVRAGRFVKPTRLSTAERVAALWCDLLERRDIDYDENFFDAGGHSLRAVALHQRLIDAFGPVVTLTDLFVYPTIRALAEQIDIVAPPELRESAEVLADEISDDLSVATDAATPVDQNAIAIIGMTGRFPSAPDLASFWRGLLDGYEGGIYLSDDELLARGVDAALLRNPNYVRHVSPLDGATDFDAVFFGLSPREAQLMDPQQRLFLEMASEVLEQAGYGSDQKPRAIGVFASCSFSYYMIENIMPNMARLNLNSSHLLLGNDKDFLATRTAYKLNLHGPAVSLGTACSSSLVAVHQACASLLAGEAEMTLAGAVSLDPDRIGYVYVEGGIMSADGHCRPFDATAGGTSNGSGGGVVLLKRLSAALRDGDTVHAVIRGSTINNDGGSKVSYTAPSVAGQAAVIRDALRAARVDACSIDYVEAHGTGTRLGDPIEVRALTQAFDELSGDTPLPAQSCAIGSVKGNIGHLDAAAGMAGLIKTVLSLKHRILPPSINCSAPNPEIRFEQTPFEVVREARPWPKRPMSPRRAGVSAFGVGGTNAHVIVEEAPAPRDDRRLGDDDYQLIPLSAKTPAALEQQAQRLASHLVADLSAQSGPARLRDVAYTMQVGRSTFRHRAFAVGNTTNTLVAQLREATRNATPAERGTPAVVFMFPGQGSQYVGMGAQLYRAGGVFRETVDRCADGLARYVERDIRDFLLGSADDVSLQQELNETRFTQPALFTIEYALACQLQDCGIVPKAIIGHSLGELVGACVAGLIGLDDALALVALRGALMQRQPSGAMLAVNASVAQLDALLAAGCEIAAMNGAQQYVLAGPLASIAVAERTCARDSIACQRLATSHAFHSSLMDQAVSPINLASPAMMEGNGIRLISNRSGQWFDEGDRHNVGYWGDHIRRPVQFHRGVDTLLAAFDEPVLLEVGPGRALGSMLRYRADLQPAQLLTTLRHPREQKADHEVLLKSIGTLWTRGVAIDWTRMHTGHKPKRTTLPTYPFERSRHWLDRPAGGSMYSVPRAPGIAFEQQRAADGATVMRFELNDRHWFVDEHRIFEGNAVLPGTGCLDLVQRAFTAWRTAAATTLTDVYFPAALILARNGRCEGRVVFTPRGDTHTFALEGRPHGTDDDWSLHATGQVSAAAAEPAAIGSLDDLRERFAMKPLQQARARFDQAFAEYGSRWHSMESIWLGERCGLARLRLADSLSGDLREHALHPALLDLATAFLSVCTRPDTAAIPFHYREVRIYAPLRAQCYSLVCETSPGQYDVTLLAADNNSDTPTVLADIRGFSLRALRASRRDPDSPDGERVSDWCRALRWVDEPLIASAQAAEPWLVFGDAQGPLRNLIDNAPPGSIVVTAARTFRALGERRVGLRQSKPNDYRQLIDLLRREQRCPSRIVYSWTASDAVASFDQLGWLIQALGVQNTPATLSVVTHGWCNAATEAACDAATAVGLLQAVNWEFPKMICRHIDVDDVMPATRAALLAELVTAPLPTAQATVATVGLANGQRRVPRYVRLPSDADKDVLRDRGVYLITGGLTGIGYEVARHIATTKSGVKLGLVSRSGLGDTSEDANLNLRNSTADRRARIEELERAGAEVLVLQADIGDPQQTSRVVDTLRQRFGPINGVVHSAGIDASGLLESGTPRAWHRVLSPKVSGTRQLCERVHEDRPDFVLLCSSLASLIGGLGQADYSAGNAYIDTIARYWRGRGLPVVAVNWDAWSETGMALDYAARKSQDTATRIRGLTNHEGCDIFALAAASCEAQIAVSKYGPINRLIERELATRNARRAAPEQTGGAGPVRDFLLGLWREMLGVEAFRDDDDFFELGGHSLLATQLISRVRDRYERCLTLAEFLDTPTLARIARSIDTGPVSSPDDVQRVVVALWRELLGVAEIASDDDFFELGGHSLLATQLISRVRDHYERCLTLAEFLDTPTVARIVASIDVRPTSHTTSASSDPAVRYCIVPLNSAGALPPFFGLPGMGGNVAQLLPLSAALGNERPFIGLQCLGLDGIAQPHSSVEQMAEHYIACLRSIQPSGPYYLGGHSLGGKVAYEMARQLHDAGEEIGLLALFDSAAPPYTTTTRIDDCMVTKVILSIFAYYTGKPQILGGETAEQLRELTLDQQLAVIQQRLEQFGVVRAQTDSRAIRGLFNVYRAAADLGPKYDPVQRPLSLPILLFKAREPMPEGMNLPEARDTDGWGWERFTCLAVRSVEVPGNHFSCLMPEQVEHLAAPLRAALDAASPRRFA